MRAPEDTAKTAKRIPKRMSVSSLLFVHVVKDLNVVSAHHPQLGPRSHGNQRGVAQLLHSTQPILQDDRWLQTGLRIRIVQFNPNDRKVVGICDDQAAEAVMADAHRAEVFVQLIFFIGVADANLLFKVTIENDDGLILFICDADITVDVHSDIPG